MAAFDFVHLDPSCDPPEGYIAAFELLAHCWCELRALRSTYPQDEFLTSLIGHLEDQLVVGGLVLAAHVELLTAL